eukprot:CAMPEP_0194291138 /NCGR_PEP_ID=MMETSP0169-20130528/42833_1 /TAXON_ID=218684 /ORGANISM="Corethron pennatum, Strain L29A3" /LENGTH=686 /DNA_ID=CAMNT_0039038935 /DNA_START=1656 /DNA_END=3716 /DNA_ORIENTATION=-
MDEVRYALSSADHSGFSEVGRIMLEGSDVMETPLLRTADPAMGMGSSEIVGATTSLVVFATVILAAVIAYRNRVGKTSDSSETTAGTSHGESTVVSGSTAVSDLRSWASPNMDTEKNFSKEQPPSLYDDDRNERSKSIIGVSSLVSQVSSMTMENAAPSSTAKNKLKLIQEKENRAKQEKGTQEKENRSQKVPSLPALKLLKKLSFTKEIQSFDMGSGESTAPMSPKTPKHQKSPKPPKSPKPSKSPKASKSSKPPKSPKPPKSTSRATTPKSPKIFKEAVKAVRNMPLSPTLMAGSYASKVSGSLCSKKSYDEMNVKYKHPMRQRSLLDLETEMQSFESNENDKKAKSGKSPLEKMKLRITSPVNRMMSPLSMSQFSFGSKFNDSASKGDEESHISPILNGLALSPRNTPPFQFQRIQSDSLCEELQMDKLIQSNTSYGTRALNLNVPMNMNMKKYSGQQRQGAVSANSSNLRGIMEVPSVLKKSVSFSFASDGFPPSDTERAKMHAMASNGSIDSFNENNPNADNSFNAGSPPSGPSKHIFRSKTDTELPTHNRKQFVPVEERIDEEDPSLDEEVSTSRFNNKEFTSATSTDEVFKVYFDDRGKLTFRLKSGGNTNVFETFQDTKAFLLKSNDALQSTWSKCKNSPFMCIPDEGGDLNGLSNVSSDGFSIFSQKEYNRTRRRYR